MQAFIDYLAALLITGTVILIILAMQFRGQQTSIDAAQFSASKRSMLSVIEMIEQDFTNIGAGFSPVDSSIQLLDTLGTLKRFHFFARTSQANPVPDLVTYQWTQAGTVELDTAATAPVYRLARRVNGVMSGTSLDVLTSFNIRLFTADSLVITNNYEDARQVRVSMTTVSPLGVSEQIEQSQWTKVFRPVNLAHR